MMFLRNSSQTTTCYWVSILVRQFGCGACSGYGRTLRRASLWLGRGGGLHPGSSLPPHGIWRTWTIFSCGVATICRVGLSSRCHAGLALSLLFPSRMRAADPVRVEGQIWPRGQVTHPGGHCLLETHWGRRVSFLEFSTPVSSHKEAAMVRLWTFTSLFLQSERALEPQTGPCVHTLHREGSTSPDLTAP